MLKQLISFVSRRAITLIGVSLAGTGAAQAADVIKIASIAPSGECIAYRLWVPEALRRYAISKGSICVDGIFECFIGGNKVVAKAVP